MQVTKRTHLQASVQNTIFMVLLVVMIGLIAWLSNRYEMKADWTINNRHTLSETSKLLLDKLSDPITITIYASNDKNLRTAFTELLERYQQHKSDINIRFIDPFTVPAEVRERGIQYDGEFIIEYQNRTEHVQEVPPSEQDITSALERVARTENRVIVFLEGHGERSPTQHHNQDLSQWASALQKRGFELHNLNFGTPTDILDTATVLVIASPQKMLLPGEVTQIKNYIEKGGNLFWLIDPRATLQGLEPLAQEFGLSIQAGIIVDPVSQLLGVNDPSVVSMTTQGYGAHPITDGFEEYVTLFPQAKGLLITETEAWQDTALLTTNPKVWSETGDITGAIEYNPETDIKGPLTIAVALDRDEKAAQRVVIVGDGDFLSNGYLGYAGNLDLGVKMMNWLALEDSFIDIPSKTAVDLNLKLSASAVLILGGFFLFLLPIMLISIGILIWLRRRKA